MSLYRSALLESTEQAAPILALNITGHRLRINFILPCFIFQYKEEYKFMEGRKLWPKLSDKIELGAVRTFTCLLKYVSVI
jgi:hypothetical protein